MSTSLRSLAQDAMSAQGVREDAWFSQHQPLLLAMARTTHGRDLLGIPQHSPEVLSITKNRITYLVDIVGDKAILWADCRVGNRIGNLIRSRFGEFTSFARYFLNGPINTSLSPTVIFARSVVCATLTARPDPDPETSTFDGSLKKDGGTYAAAHDSATATLGLSSETATTFDVQNGDEGTNNYYISRGVTLFATTLTGTVTAADYILVCNSVAANATSDSISIVSATTASNTTRTNTDYAGFGTTKYASDILISAMSSGSTHTWAFNATGVAAINTSGITKIGVRTARDVANTSPGTGNNCQVFFRSADYADVTSDPRLVLTYTVPAKLLSSFFF